MFYEREPKRKLNMKEVVTPDAPKAKQKHLQAKGKEPQRSGLQKIRSAIRTGIHVSTATTAGVVMFYGFHEGAKALGQTKTIKYGDQVPYLHGPQHAGKETFIFIAPTSTPVMDPEAPNVPPPYEQTVIPTATSTTVEKYPLHLPHFPSLYGYVPNPTFQIIHSNSASIIEMGNVIYAANPALANVRLPTPQGEYIGFADYLGRACAVDGVDASVVAAIFAKESTDGLYGWAAINKSIGNIRALDGQPQNGGYRAYTSWAEAINDTCGLLHNYAKWGFTDVPRAIAKWAPPEENDTAAYIAFVEDHMNTYTQGSKYLSKSEIKNLRRQFKKKPLVK